MNPSSMSQSESNSDKSSASSSPENAVERQFNDTEPLFERPTRQRHPQEVLKYGIAESILNGETALFDVLPGVGKSRSISTVAKVIPTTVLANLKENYEQYQRWGRDDGLPVQKLPVATDLCPTLQGSHSGISAAKDAQDAYRNGWSPSTIHREFDLPCERGKNTCPYCEKVAEIDPGALDLLVGHYTQGYNPAYIKGRVVVIDEDCFDDFIQEIKKPVAKAEEFINKLDDFPFDAVRRPEVGEKQKREDALTKLEEVGLEPTEHGNSIGEFHAKAPLVAYAIYGAERMDNDLNVAELPGGQTAVFDNLHGSVWLFEPPDFSGAEAVIALDATPCLVDWERILGDDLKHYRLFDDDQRNRYLQEQGYEFVQLNSHIWPVSGGGVSIPKCEAYLREIRREHGQRPELLSSKKVINALEGRDLGHLWRDDLHYWDLRGKNDLEESELLVVLGSPGRGDIDIQYHAAFHGECAEPATDEDGERLSGHDLDYQSEVANDILESIRRGEVFQAAMRAGRTEDAKATVYIATGMVPDWLETKTVGRRRPNGSFDVCEMTRNDSDRDVLSVLRDEDGISGREIARRAGLPKSTARDALDRLRNEGLVELRGRGRGAEWHADGVEDVNIAGCVDLERMADIPLKDSIRASRPFSDPLIPHREPPADPTARYSDWMLDVMRRLEARSFDEQLKQYWRKNS